MSYAKFFHEVPKTRRCNLDQRLLLGQEGALNVLLKERTVESLSGATDRGRIFTLYCVILNGSDSKLLISACPCVQHSAWNLVVIIIYNLSLLCARLCARFLICLISMNSHKNLGSSYDFCPHFKVHKTEVHENYLTCQVTQFVSGGDQVQVQQLVNLETMLIATDSNILLRKQLGI